MRTSFVDAARPRAFGARSASAFAGAGLVATMLAAVNVAAPASAAVGQLQLRPGAGDSASSASVFTDGRAGATFQVPSASAPTYLSVMARGAGGSGYRAKVSVQPSGDLAASLVRVVGGSETVLDSRPLGFRARAGSHVRLQLRVDGSSPVMLQMRAWKMSSERPDWQLAIQDGAAARVTGGGTPKAEGWLSSRASDAVAVPFRRFTSAAATSSGGTDGGGTDGGGTGTTPDGSRPTRANTGVPDGTNLTRHDGDITVTRDGTVLDGLDVHGFVTIKANNVTIKNSIIRGGTATYNRGLVTNLGYQNLLVVDSDLVWAKETVWNDGGIKGNNFTARRVYIHGGVDSMKVQKGGNVLVEDSLLEDAVYWARDPNQGGGPSHSDGIQVQDGANVRIIGNTIRNQPNFPILGAAAIGHTSGLVVRGNWLDGGHCTVKFQELGSYQLTATIENNKFGPNRKVSYCPINATDGSSVQASGNTLEASGDTAKVYWTNS